MTLSSCFGPLFPDDSKSKRKWNLLSNCFCLLLSNLIPFKLDIFKETVNIISKVELVSKQKKPNIKNVTKQKVGK